MHTFFINTSRKALNGYDVLFDIYRENKALVSMECLMADWYDPEKGYLACVSQMSDMIDGYVELNNAFNLIIYIDLPENKAYSAIQRDAFHDKEREECCAAMHILFTHVISESVVKKLSDSGRKPQNVLILFGEEKQFNDFAVAASDPRREDIMKRVFRYIGLPERQTVQSIAEAVHREGAQDPVAAFEQKIFESCSDELVQGLRCGYYDDLRLWFDAVIHEADIQYADEKLFKSINSIHRMESDRIGIEILSCPYDCYACQVNKSVLALSELNLALYLLKCVEANTVYDPREDDRKRLIPFHAYSVEEIAPILKEKMEIYAEKVAEIENLAKSYDQLGLAPKLRVFDHGKFGLDPYGDVATELVVAKAEEAAQEQTPPENADTGAATLPEEPVPLTGSEQEVTVVQKQGTALFTEQEYAPFDYDYQAGSDAVLGSNVTPEQYVEQAKKVRKHNLEYLKKLKAHVTKVLSNYAGRSKENKAALLQMGGYRYSTFGQEKKPLEAVEEVAAKAYQTIVEQYMEFCAGRSVAISDIEEQCNWLVTRIQQIKQSLQRIKLVAIGILVAILALYIPYVWIQFEAITENIVTVTTALCSLGVPIALLYLIFTVLALLQRKKYRKAWKDFQERSNAALESNKVAVQKFDQLLSAVIPALRWVYEYKLDVGYCAECCSIADAKVEHHRRKLRDRITAIRNILSDLEYRAPEHTPKSKKPADYSEMVDYNVAFCSGKKNCDFYAVLDSSVLNKMES